MFREFWKALSRMNATDKTGLLFARMLDHGHWMFDQATAAWWRRGPSDRTHDAIYARDMVINDLVRDVRREVVRHLVINPARNVTFSLVLMNAAKDAERIGDYCKNILDASRAFGGEFQTASYRGLLEDITADVGPLFRQVRSAICEDDRDAGRRAFRTAREIGERCDLLVEALLRQQEEMPAGEAVAYGLMSRHLKRIASHLGNIASSSVASLENLDFGDDGAPDYGGNTEE